jgi:hypothetical protein
MKYICLGYLDEKNWEKMSENEQNALVDECFAYDDVLRKNNHFFGGEALQSPRNAATLRWDKGKVSITDGPLCRDERAVRRDSDSRRQRLEPCDPFDVAIRASRQDPGRFARLRT